MNAGLLVLQYLVTTAILLMVFVLTKAWRLSSGAKSVFFTLLLIVYGLSMTLVMPLLGLVVDVRAGWAPILLSLAYLLVLIGVPFAIYHLFSRLDHGRHDEYPFPRLELVLEVLALALISFALCVAALVGILSGWEEGLARMGNGLLQFILVTAGTYLLLRGLSGLVIGRDVSYFRSLNSYSVKGRPFLQILYLLFAFLFSTLLLAQYFLL